MLKKFQLRKKLKKQWTSLNQHSAHTQFCNFQISMKINIGTNFYLMLFFAFNTSYNNRTGFTPFYINHRFEANLPGQLPMAMHHQEATKEITILPSSYCAEVLSKFQTCFQLVKYEAHKCTRCTQILFSW